MPWCHNLDAYLHAGIDSAGLVEAEGCDFRTAIGRTKWHSYRPTSQADAFRMFRRRAAGAGVLTKIGDHSFRAAGVTEYLKNGGKLEVAQQMTNPKRPPLETASTTGAATRTFPTRSN